MSAQLPLTRLQQRKWRSWWIVGTRVQLWQILGLALSWDTSKQHLVNLTTCLKLPLTSVLQGSCTLAFALPVSEAGAVLGSFQSWVLRKCPQLSLSTWLWGLVLLRVLPSCWSRDALPTAVEHGVKAVVFSLWVFMHNLSCLLNVYKVHHLKLAQFSGSNWCFLKPKPFSKWSSFVKYLRTMRCGRVFGQRRIANVSLSLCWVRLPKTF